MQLSCVPLWLLPRSLLSLDLGLRSVWLFDRGVFLPGVAAVSVVAMGHDSVVVEVFACSCKGIAASWGFAFFFSICRLSKSAVV